MFREHKSFHALMTYGLMMIEFTSTLGTLKAIILFGLFLLLNLRASVKLQLACAKGWSPIELLNRPGDRVTGGNGSVWVSINFPIFVTLSYDPTISWCQCIRSFEGRAPSVPGKILKKYPSPY